jgi:predicted nucleic acid-binding protein
VLLRVVLGEPGRLVQWSKTSVAFTSEISRVECLRVLDRLRLAGHMDDRELARRRETCLKVLTGFEIIRVNRTVLDRAAAPFPLQIRTLDAIHLASALLTRTQELGLRFATHDDDLGSAARAEGMHVIGV